MPAGDSQPMGGALAWAHVTLPASGLDHVSEVAAARDALEAYIASRGDLCVGLTEIEVVRSVDGRPAHVLARAPVVGDPAVRLMIGDALFWRDDEWRPVGFVSDAGVV